MYQLYLLVDYLVPGMYVLTVQSQQIRCEGFALVRARPVFCLPFFFSIENKQNKPTEYVVGLPLSHGVEGRDQVLLLAVLVDGSLYE